MDLTQLRVMFTVVVTLFVTGLACLPFVRSNSASQVVLVMALVLCAVLGTAVAVTIYRKARRGEDD